jgi:orotidine-5'-phosphate decarboxylase
MKSSFYQRLSARWKKSQSLVCVGIDPIGSKLPTLISSDKERFFQFGKAIVEACAEHVCAFKPQFAHFAAEGRESELERLIEFIKLFYPDIPVVLDAKRGDIGSTADLYAAEAFERYAADAVTVNPYLGFDSVDPFLEYADKGVILLCRTSNPSAIWIQDAESEGEKVFLKIARKAKERNVDGQIALVTGATYPEDLGLVRAIVRDMPLLVPGIGAQGGDLNAVLDNGLDSQKSGLLISSSREIIYASRGPDFPEAASRAAEELCKKINKNR